LPKSYKPQNKSKYPKRIDFGSRTSDLLGLIIPKNSFFLIGILFIVIVRAINVYLVQIEGDTGNYFDLYKIVNYDVVLNYRKGPSLPSLFLILKSFGLSFRDAIFLILVSSDLLIWTVIGKLSGKKLGPLIALALLQWNYAFISTSSYLLRQYLGVSIGIFCLFSFTGYKRYLGIIFGVAFHPITGVYFVSALFFRLRRYQAISAILLILPPIIWLLKNQIEEIPVDRVEVNQSHVAIFYLVIFSAVMSLLIKTPKSLLILLLTTLVFMISLRDLDLIFYRLTLAAYVVTIPICFKTIIIDGYRNLYFKL
jgi:hypothetical protein